MRSLATNALPAEPDPVSVTPSLSGLPEPPGKRRGLPEDQPLAVSGFQPPEPSRTWRYSLPLFCAHTQHTAVLVEAAEVLAEHV